MDRHGLCTRWHRIVCTEQIIDITARIFDFNPNFLPCMQPRESLLWRLQPVPLVIRLISLDDMERIYESALITAVLFTPVQYVAVDEHQRSRLDLAHGVLLLVRLSNLLPVLQRLRELCALVVDESGTFGAGRLAGSHESLGHWCPLVAACRKA